MLNSENNIQREIKESERLYRIGEYNKAIVLTNKILANRKYKCLENKIREGSLYSNLALSYSAKGDIDKAFDFYNNALYIFSNHLGKYSFEAATVYNNLAALFAKKLKTISDYRYINKYDIKSSLFYYKKSLSIYLKLFNFNSIHVATIYNNLSIISIRAGHFKKAYLYLTRSAKIYTHLFGKKSLEISNTFQIYSKYYYYKKNYLKSLKYLYLSINILIHLKEHDRNISIRYKNISLIYIKLGMFNEAMNSINKSISIYSKKLNYSKTELFGLNTDIHILEFLHIKSSILLLKYKKYRGSLKPLEIAFNNYKNISYSIDSIRQNYFYIDSKNLLSSKTVYIYEKAIEVCLELYYSSGKQIYLDEAYKYSQKSKAISLIESVNDYVVKQHVGIPSSLSKKENNLRKKIADIEKLIYIENKNSGKSESIIKELRNKLFKVKERYEITVKKIQKEYTGFSDVKYDEITVSIDEIKKHIQENTMIIEYFLGEEYIFAFVFTKETCFVNKIKKSRNFEKKIREYRDLLTQINSFTDSRTSLKFKYLSHYFYKVLLRNILETQKCFDDSNSGKENPVKNILIVPDNELNFIPFDSLITSDFDRNTEFKDLPYLIKYFNIIYSYSVILYLKNISEEDKRSKLNILAFAPSFHDQNDRKDLIAKDTFRDSLSPLRYNLKEIKGISKIFDGKYYFDKEALKENFIRNKKHFSVLHLATHSVLDDTNSLYSKIVFSKSSENVDEGYLYTFEIYTLNSRYDLVVLSACNTGFGRMIRGEGVMSIARAFASTGSKNIVMSLWQVNDRSTSEIMKFFYGFISKGQKVGEALRNAKLLYLKKSSGLRSLPFYWSPFISYGTNNNLN